MKNSLMNLYDKLMLRKRSVIETVNDELKNVCQIYHSSFKVLLSRRVAYAIMDYMQDNGLSRNDVAEKLGVSPQYVSKILSGKVNFSFKTISEIEEGLGIELFQAAAMEA